MQVNVWKTREYEVRLWSLDERSYIWTVEKDFIPAMIHRVFESIPFSSFFLNKSSFSSWTGSRIKQSVNQLINHWMSQSDTTSSKIPHVLDIFSWSTTLISYIDISGGQFRLVFVLCSFSVICRLHFQGKCSVIKALDLRVPPKLPRPRRTTNDDIIYPTGVIRKKRRTQSDPSKIWIRELEESLKTPFSFNESKKVDEHRENSER